MLFKSIRSQLNRRKYPREKSKKVIGGRSKYTVLMQQNIISQKTPAIQYAKWLWRDMDRVM